MSADLDRVFKSPPDGSLRFYGFSTLSHFLTNFSWIK
nr:MAG TPA_asm: LabA-like protein [Caudoviricetes sp.]